ELGSEDHRSDVAGLISSIVRSGARVTVVVALVQRLRDRWGQYSALMYMKRNKAVTCYLSLLSNHVHIEGLFVKVLFSGSYTRVRAHLLKISGKGIRFCAKVTSTKLEELKKLDSESTLLHETKNPYFVKVFSYAANNYIDGYIPPGYNKLRTTLLEKEKQHVERMLEPTKNSWSGKGIKDKDYVAKQIRDVIREVGLSNVVQIVTNNAPVCKAASLLIEAEFPSVFWTPCVVHTLNLALKDICAAKNTEKNNFVYQECSWITQIADDASFIKNFIVNHHMRLSIFNEFNTLKLLNVAPTRFASTIVMLKRFRLLKQ
ncbi:hypothetical protein S245_046951, partial [Arachis hypogaea]